MSFDKAIESIKTIKLTGGIFGKTTLLLIVLCLSMAAVSIKIGNIWLVLTLMILISVLSFYALKRCFDFAERNPQAAIMEGSEFLAHERIVHGMKDDKNVPPHGSIIDHPQPSLSNEEVNKDDPPLTLPLLEIDVIKPDDEGAR